MLLAGPSKAGKSFALIELCIAIAEGRPWLGRFSCAQGKVLYINLELDRASCLHRFKDVYTALGLPPQNLRNIDIWNLRGASVPMDKLAPKLIRRAQKKGYTAVILDPIYKVITGDENSADQMAKFCNQFDLVCRALDCAVIYCHHHSKGAQGGKRSMDRASGSGVFARDPDAMLDMTELVPTDAIREQLHNKAACRVIKAMLDKRGHADAYGPDDILSRSRMLAIAKEHLGLADLRAIDAEVAAAQKQQVQSFALGIVGKLNEALGGARDQLVQGAIDLGGQIVNGLTGGFSEVWQQAQGLGSTLVSVFQGLQGPLSAVALAISKGLQGGLISAFPEILASLGGLIGSIGGAFVAMLDAIAAALFPTGFGTPQALLMIAAGVALAAVIAGIVASIGGSFSKKGSSGRGGSSGGSSGSGGMGSVDITTGTGSLEDAINANTKALEKTNSALADMIRQAGALVLSDNMRLGSTVAASGTAQVVSAARSYHREGDTNITQNIYSKAQTAADLQREARWEADKARRQRR